MIQNHLQPFVRSKGRAFTIAPLMSRRVLPPITLAVGGLDHLIAALAQQADVDVVVELIGGSDGPALTLARSTLAAGKSFVTANKAMLAHHGYELATAAEAAAGRRKAGGGAKRAKNTLD